ncbi:UNVERIFIED_CONTAM: hypothetical protein P3E47_27610, partial [Pseudomonas aeruginosa]
PAMVTLYLANSAPIPMEVVGSIWSSGWKQKTRRDGRVSVCLFVRVQLCTLVEQYPNALQSAIGP